MGELAPFILSFGPGCNSRIIRKVLLNILTQVFVRHGSFKTTPEKIVGINFASLLGSTLNWIHNRKLGTIFMGF